MHLYIHACLYTLAYILTLYSTHIYTLYTGKRVRKQKERYAMTEMRAQQNRVSFDPNEGEYGDSAMGLDQVHLVVLYCE